MPKQGGNKTLARESNGHRFKPGESGNPKGRPKGAKNKVPREFKEFCEELVKDPSYHEALRKRAMRGRIAPAIEAQILDRGAGPVAKRVDVSVTIADIVAGLPKPEPPDGSGPGGGGAGEG